jgi:hypothetical protein
MIEKESKENQSLPSPVPGYRPVFCLARRNALESPKNQVSPVTGQSYLNTTARQRDPS